MTIVYAVVKVNGRWIVTPVSSTTLDDVESCGSCPLIDFAGRERLERVAARQNKKDGIKG